MSRFEHNAEGEALSDLMLLPNNTSQDLSQDSNPDQQITTHPVSQFNDVSSVSLRTRSLNSPPLPPNNITKPRTALLFKPKTHF